MFSDCTQPFRLSFYTDQLPDTVTAAIENLSLSRGEISIGHQHLYDYQLPMNLSLTLKF